MQESFSFVTFVVFQQLLFSLKLLLTIPYCASPVLWVDRGSMREITVVLYSLENILGTYLSSMPQGVRSLM